jgi:hypothetical protein
LVLDDRPDLSDTDAARLARALADPPPPQYDN